MYAIVPEKKPKDIISYDYVFESLKAFYEIASAISLPLVGRYNICVITDDAKAVQEFVKNADKYNDLCIDIYMPEVSVDYLTSYNTRLPVKNKMKMFDIFKELIMKYNLLIDKKAVSVLYSAIEHTYEEMDTALKHIKDEYGSYNRITESMITRLFVVNKITYPRNVLISYLLMERYRRSKLEQCIKNVGENIALRACIKNVKILFNEKVTYYQTGNGSKLIRMIDSRRLNLMYRVLVTERNNLNDLSMLLEFYERGMTPYDFI